MLGVKNIEECIMSLTGFISMPDVRAKITPLRPKMPRKIDAPLRVEPRSSHYMVVGTAFDYLLRFELKRCAPHAVAERWVAEYAPDIIWREREGMESCLDLLSIEDMDEEKLLSIPGRETYDELDLAKEVSGHARSVVEKARLAVAAYLQNKSPTRSDQAALAAHAIRLAKLDEMYRALQLDPSFEDADQWDVEDMLDMLAIVPTDPLIDSKLMLLNPTFGESSRLVGGADTDLIAGDMIVDFKTTKRGEMRAKELDQLLGYFFLARNQRRMDSSFPEIKRLALYFCRHGHLWALDTTTWMDHPEFAEIETWFFKRANKVHEASKLRQRKRE